MKCSFESCEQDAVITFAEPDLTQGIDCCADHAKHFVVAVLIPYVQSKSKAILCCLPGKL